MVHNSEFSLETPTLFLQYNLHLNGFRVEICLFVKMIVRPFLNDLLLLIDGYKLRFYTNGFCPSYGILRLIMFFITARINKIC